MRWLPEVECSLLWRVSSTVRKTRAFQLIGGYESLQHSPSGCRPWLIFSGYLFPINRADCVFLYFIDPKPTLTEELAAEKEEELTERKYEDYVARRAKMTSGN